MALSNDLISQFVKITKSDKKKDKETIAYGTVAKIDQDESGEISAVWVRLDGAGQNDLTPLSRTTDVKLNDRVIVMIKNHSAVITGNITSPSARTEYVKVVEEKVLVSDAKIAEFDTLLADKVSTKEFYSEVGRVENLKADKATVEELSAEVADIEELTAKKIDAETVKSEYATIANLNTTNLEVTSVKGDVADINTLIFGSAAGTTIQMSFANAVIAQLGDAQIKSAMIDNVSASKITSGDIVTNNVRVVSEDGKLVISDETIQISDGTRVRVQIGKDASNDYSINIWDADGELMFGEGGITDNAIKEAIIRNDMVSDEANISASKLDIDSLFTEINGSSNTIKSTKVYLDDKMQTLDVAFKELSGNVSSQGTAISVIQGSIETKIWQQDINEATGAMSTQYSSLKQDVDGLTVRLGTAETNIGAAQSTADNAAKTATNYLSFNEGGLVVGDMTVDILGSNVRIDSDSVDIRSGDVVLASFGADYLYLAKNSRDATIDLCDGLAKMYHTVDDTGYSQFNIDTTYALSYVKISAPMHDLLVLENTNSTNGVIVKGMINGSTVGGFGLVRDGHMVRYGSDADEDNPVEYRLHDEENFGTIDSDWKYGGVIGEHFTLYDNDYQIQYRKIGKIVQVRGQVRPTQIIPGSTDSYTIFTLPAGYRPSAQVWVRCQGSGSYSWLLSITTSGTVRFSRYNDGAKYVDTSTTSWLPFHVTFFVD